MTVPYDLQVDFSLKICRKIELFGVKYLRCGLVSVGSKNIFVAIDDVIRVYEKSSLFGLRENTFKKLKCQVDPHTAIQGEIDVQTPLSFNSIKVGYFGYEEVLVCCTDSGYINAWFTDDLLRSPLIFNTGRSAWGIAIHTSKRLLAISSNAHDISLWNLSVFNPFKAWDTDTREWPHKFYGHNDNIPSICFNQDGTLLSSVGIDATCRLWDVASGSLLHVYLDSQRGWFVGFIDPLAFKVVKRVDASEKRTKSTFNQIMTSSLSKNYTSDRNVLYLMDEWSDTSDDGERSIHDIRTNDLWDIQNPFLTNLSIQNFFRQNHDIQSNSVNLFPFLEYEELFSLYTPTQQAELLFYGTEKSIKICNVNEATSEIQLMAECENIFDTYTVRAGIVKYLERINMVEFIPELSLCIVASQKGKACLMHSVKSVMNCEDGSTLSSYTMIAHQLFPENPPSCGLLGITVEKIFSKRYKLYMIYYDGTLILYEIKKPVYGIIEVDNLIL